MSAADERPLIAHVVFRFDYGGLENGVVNVINGLPETLFRHTVIALTDASDFQRRIRRQDVTVHALNKRAGKDPGSYMRLFRLLRQLRPAIVHTRNLGTLDCTLVARLAGVPSRIHGEHGWDTYDPDGTNRKYRALRRMLNPTIDRFVTVSSELEQWLVQNVGIQAAKVQRICNGVNTDVFRPRSSPERTLLPAQRFPPHSIVVGSVTRFMDIKDPLNLVRGFIAARREQRGSRLRLLMVGDGSLREPAQALLDEAGEAANAWLPGSRDDVAALLREMDVFALSSRREGISNTVLEAMASGVPVVASATGGNLELIEDGRTGTLVPAADSDAIARALLAYASDDEMREWHGRAARARAEREYSLRRMLADYESLYRAQCNAVEEAA
jgi:sugar transferase (PEP-CTERM/EpsH1 system associated)